MKYSEVHRIIRRNGWELKRTKGRHPIYEKDGKIVPVPNHGSKEMPEGLRKKIFKEMGLK
ncbi:MAG TPA: type II toxin-antitoxin system HicA family toxin [Puia sp.]|nr:type II toxin-antitoxin system HicA family toxin [Puia sp.]